MSGRGATRPVSLGHAVAISVISLLVGASGGIWACAGLFPEGSDRWEQLRDMGETLSTVSVVLGLGWLLYLLHRTKRRSGA
jgi:hypothetical protein